MSRTNVLAFKASCLSCTAHLTPPPRGTPSPLTLISKAGNAPTSTRQLLVSEDDSARNRNMFEPGTKKSHLDLSRSLDLQSVDLGKAFS